MNELVSKNPVQRFKQDKKIVKAQFGTVLGYATRYLNPFGSAAAAYDIYNAIPKNTITKHLSNFYYGYDRDAHLKRQNKLKNTPREITKNGKRFWYGSDGSMTDLELYNKRNSPNSEPKQSIGTVTATPRTSKPSVTPTYYTTSAYRNKIPVSGLNSRAAVMEYQKKLNKLGANIKVDGIWGNNTQAAYDKYKRDQLFSEAESVKASPLSLVENYNINPNDFVSTVKNKYGKPTIEPISTQYDRSGTRDWITNRLGHNPYEYTGAQRRALRYWLNGDKEGTNYDKNLLGVFGNLSQYAKQGAKLVSRNPVQRFKINFR